MNRGTSLIRNNPTVGPYSKPMPITILLHAIDVATLGVASATQAV